jgi:tetratricopeptide (TPR) repeat protein
MTRRAQGILKAAYIFMLVLGLQGLASAEDGILQRAKTLVENGKAPEAYALLSSLEEQRSGEPDFDYLLGVAALDSGQPGRAVFALERVLAVNPAHTLARAEIARAYFVLGERKTAKQEFQSVLKENPPEQVNQAINKYLSAIDKEQSDHTKFSAFLEFALGYDSNANSSTGSQQIAIPAFGGLVFTLDPKATKLSSNFSNLGAGIGFTHPISQNISLFGAVKGYQHINLKSEAEQFDTSTIDASLGASIKNNRDLYTVAIQDNDFSLNSDGYRRAYGLIGQWQRTIDNSNQVSAFLQASRLEYPKQSIRDADRYVAGVGYGHAFSGDYLPVLFVSGYLGTEDERHSGVPQLGNDLYGVRVGGQLTYNPKTIVSGSASYEHRDYGGQEPLWLVSRTDKQFDASIGVKYMPASFFSINPQFSYTHNDSTVPIDNYNRYTFSVTLRRDFGW